MPFGYFGSSTGTPAVITAEDANSGSQGFDWFGLVNNLLGTGLTIYEKKQDQKADEAVAKANAKAAAKLASIEALGAYATAQTAQAQAQAAAYGYQAQKLKSEASSTLTRTLVIGGAVVAALFLMRK